MTMTNLNAQRSQYTQDAILSASPVRLLTMLYDRLLLDLGRAEQAHGRADWAVVSTTLLHAQAIVSELSSSLRVELWDGGERLLALYTYVGNQLMMANVRREVEGIRECIALLEPLRAAWHEAGATLSAQQAPPTARGELGVA
jgi:flagellar protein FliS